ncbi:helix-turn-helix domain-containing protein [Aeromonas enteropelogenes]|uniref:helix-turn-helix domain-containing protein n=1 Tax=Aeromonas enteropelogenes TaxID=29489 RepID=UPI001CCCD797|nr:helix-turn-helix transcriptional regulator [Aeromonas enteropelogenes]UBH27750.1 helix-turn-helix transcriptional regulator [Aeromonas enteropelogenes]
MSQFRTMPTALKLQELGSMIQDLQQELALREEEGKTVILESQIQSSESFGARLNQQRKELGIDLHTLELQTGVSISTLKRLFKDPEQVKFSTICAVSSALGVKICAVK